MQDVIRDFLIWLAAFVTLSAAFLVLVHKFVKRYQREAAELAEQQEARAEGTDDT